MTLGFCVVTGWRTHAWISSRPDLSQGEGCVSWATPSNRRTLGEGLSLYMRSQLNTKWRRLKVGSRFRDLPVFDDRRGAQALLPTEKTVSRNTLIPAVALLGSLAECPVRECSRYRSAQNHLFGAGPGGDDELGTASPPDRESLDPSFNH